MTDGSIQYYGFKVKVQTGMQMTFVSEWHVEPRFVYSQMASGLLFKMCMLDSLFQHI